MSKQLIGTWEHVPGEPGQSWLKSAKYVFEPDGTLPSLAHGVGNRLNLRIEIEGKWRVKNGFLVQQITKISHPGVVPIGLVTKDRILSLEGDLLSTRSDEGNVWRMRRSGPN